MTKVIVYLDNSANIKEFKELHHHCKFISSSYDEFSRKQKKKEGVATPSAMQWRDWHTPWELSHFSWDSMIGSDNLEAIYAIIGKDPQERRDGLHLDSAYKSRAHLFLTGDKKNIVHHRDRLESLLRFRIFYCCSSSTPIDLKVQKINVPFREKFIYHPYSKTQIVGTYG